MFLTLEMDPNAELLTSFVLSQTRNNIFTKRIFTKYVQKYG